MDGCFSYCRKREKTLWVVVFGTVTILSTKVLEMLKLYYRKYRPEDYLSEGVNGGKYSSLSIQQVLKVACKKAEITSIADQILTAKKSNPQNDTSAFEKQIDELVYKLYDLTEEEIAIIENSTNKTPKENG